MLHDMFAVPFTEIAQILDKSRDASEALASLECDVVRPRSRRRSERDPGRQEKLANGSEAPDA